MTEPNEPMNPPTHRHRDTGLEFWAEPRPGNKVIVFEEPPGFRTLAAGLMSADKFSKLFESIPPAADTPVPTVTTAGTALGYDKSLVTGGGWFVSDPQFGFSEIRSRLGAFIFGIAAGGEHEKRPDDVCAANAAFIAEAGTVLHETGMTPRELADEVNRLRAEIKYQHIVIGDYDRHLADNAAEIERLRAENFAMTVPHIHSCHHECPRPECVRHRDNERLRAALTKADRFIRQGVYHPLVINDPKNELPGIIRAALEGKS